MQCPQCGASNPDRARFCMDCGARLRVSREPRDYTPRHLAQRILSSRHALVGERKWVTVLFADISESVQLAGQVDAETWHRVLDGFFDILTAAVHAYEGTVNQFTGDGIMALFGAPVAHEDHAVRACLAATAMRKEVNSYADALRREQGLNLSLRIGLHTGEVVVGSIGDDLRMDYTAQGQEVALAARVVAVAAADSIFATAATHNLVESHFRWRDLGDFRFKGFDEPVRVYELEGRGAARTRWDVARARGLSRFVGRDRELEALRRLARQVEQGGRRLVAVVSEAGLGKSRLCYELEQWARSHRWRVTQVQCPAHGNALPYTPVTDLIRGYFGINAEDTAQSAREKIAGRLVMIDEQLRESLSIVFDFLGLGSCEVKDPDLKLELLQELLQQLLVRDTIRQPALIVIEDLQWLDEESERFLDLINTVDSARALFLINYRPEYQSPWQGDWVTELQLRPLDKPAILSMVRSHLGDDPSLAVLLERIHAQTAGNPFYVEEVTRTLIAEGSLTGAPGAYRLAAPLNQIAIPPSVYSLIAARIDQLAEGDKELLGIAAVVGERFGQDMLASLTGGEVTVALERLLEGFFIDPARDGAEAVYQFHHPLILEVAYRTQLRERRVASHRQIANALIARGANTRGEQFARLAHHWLGAEDWPQALTWRKRAATWAMARDLGEAYRHWRQLLELAGEHQEVSDAGTLTTEAQVALLEIGWRVARPLVELTPLFEAASASARTQADDFSLARILTAYALAEVFAGEIERAIRHLRVAAEAAERQGSLNLRVNVKLPLTYTLALAGRVLQAEQLIEQTIARVKNPHQVRARASEFNPSVWLWGMRAIPRTYRGNFEGALRDVEHALQVARSIGDSSSEAAVCGMGVLVGWLTGQPSLARRYADAQLRAAQRIGGRKARAGAMDSVGLASSMEQRYPQAVESHDAALAVMRETGVLQQTEAVVLANLAWALLGCGRLDDAAQRAAEAVAVAQRRGLPVLECRGWLMVVRVELAVGGESARERAETAARKALTIVQATEARCYEPLLRVELARLAQAREDYSRAERERARALRLFQDFGVTPHADLLAGGAPRRRAGGSNIP